MQSTYPGRPQLSSTKGFHRALRRGESLSLFRKVKPAVWKETQWVVHSEPVGTGETTVRYLSRYVGRVALSERAILHHDADCITLRYRKSGTNEPRTLRLEPPEFIRRFLQHVLPSGLHKIRHFGLHHSSKRAQLRRLQAALALRARLPMPEPEPPTSAPPPACPQCQAPMRCEGRVSARGVLILFALRTSARGPP